jgi:dephospho-CoA kinase
MMKIVGLTGGIATGKSTVSEMLRQRGVSIIDADLIAREVVTPGKKAWKKIRRAFGDEVLSEKGEIDREKLGKLVFQDTRARITLNRATHPYVYREILKQMIIYFLKGTHLLILDAALLLETKTRHMVRSVIVVYTDPDTQLRRLMARDGYTSKEAIQRIQAQMPLKEKCRRADYVIDNSSSLVNTQQQVDRILKELCR